LEILVVIIIVGVLASVAMPTLFKNVESARASEALNTLGVMKRQMDGCAMQFNSNYANCYTFPNIGMTDPSFTTNPGSHFNYTFVGAGGAGTFTLRATRVVLDNGNAGDSITMALAGGVIARSGNGAFTNIK
jgi:type II secretory pathway pseudopilin PulG